MAQAKNPRVLKQSDVEKFRENPRALVALPAVGWMGSKTQKHWIRIVDISQTGVRILDMEHKPEPGSLVKIWWRLMAGLEEIELKGRVVWSKKGSCGLNFENVGRKEAHLLSQFVKFHRSEISA